MSFFFAKKKPTVKRNGAPTKAAQSNPAAKETLNRLGCKVCPLNKVDNCTPKMPPIIVANPSIYFLGDMPDEKDDRMGKPFAGQNGKIIKSILGSVADHCFDNVVRDYNPVEARNPGPIWVAMECCRSHVTRSIELARPRLIVGLGVTPLQWMLNSSDMVALRGRLFAVKVGNHACWFMPTYDPTTVLRNAFDGRDPLRSKLGHCLKFDLIRATQLARTLEPPKIDTPQQARAAIHAFNGQSRAQLPKLLELIREARKAPIKAIDLETYPLRPYARDARLLTFAISFGNTNFSFAIDHPDAGWKPAEKNAIHAALLQLLSDQTTIVAHNAPFEIEWLIHFFGKEAIWHDVWECTMMQSHFIDERRGKRGGNDEQYAPNPYQALGFLVKQYFGLDFKTLFKVDRKNMHRANLDETLLYNAADTKYTLLLYYKQIQILKAEKLLRAYREAVARQPTVALMQSIGIDIDQSSTKEMQVKLGGEIKSVEKQINNYPEVQAFIRDRKAINIASTQDVLKLLKNYVKVGTSLINSDGKESVDKTILERIDHPIGKDIERFRNRSKLKSTYVDVFEYGKGDFIWADTKIHPTFNTTFAETGRTSSDQPNQQNWPSRNDKWVRKQIVAPKGHLLVAFDYGQLEACTAAMCTRDKVLVKALWENYDIHMEWAIKAAKIYPQIIGGSQNIKDAAIMKKFRSLIKNKLVFPVIFGASNTSVAGYLNMPQDKVDRLMDEFWSTFTGLYNWQKKIMSDYYQLGYVESPTGRRRHYPLSKNQAVNYPIQSVACDIVCHAMVELSVYAAQTNKWYLHPIMNIHDDLTFSIPDEENILEDSIKKIYRTMITPAYDFINVPMSVSCSIGSNWLEMNEIGKFWSHKDL